MSDNIFDNDDIFQEFSKEYTPAKLNREEEIKIKALLAYPDIRPAEFDRTLEAWLFRISLWGKISMDYNSPEDKENRRLSIQDFFNTTDNVKRNKLRGKWDVEKVKVNVVRFYRNYKSNGKKYEEEIVVTIDLKEEIKKVLKKI